jgi:hypothetical protein
MNSDTIKRDKALADLQDAIRPDVSDALDAFAELLGGLPPEDIEPAIYGGIAKDLVRILEETAPEMPESLRWSLPYAFAELLRERLKRTTAPMIAPSEKSEAGADEEEHPDHLPA